MASSHHSIALFLLIVTPHLLALDHNQNQVSDVWESKYPDAASDWLADPDQDGSTNREEGLAFTTPNDPKSFFALSSFEFEPGKFHLGYPGERWMRDLTQVSPDQKNWTRLTPPLVSNGDPSKLNEASSNEQNFYRCIRYQSLNSDTDGLTNKEEEILGTNPLAWDTDGDKVADDLEFLIGTDPLKAADLDGDSLPDDFEWWCIREDPSDPFRDLTDISPTTDFDGDTITDGREFALGTSPVVKLKNILFFITEDQSVHLGSYDTNPKGGYAGTSGDPADNTTRGLKTPNLNALAESGLIFDRAFCLSPVCSPSKMALFTGTYPHTNSAHRNVTNYGVRFPLPKDHDPSLLNLGGVHEDIPTLIEIFRDRGWHTAVSSKTHTQPIRKFPWHQGHPNLGTPAAAKRAMEKVIKDSADRPFFFWANVGSPHLPFRAMPKANGLWSDKGGLTGDGHVTNIDPGKIDIPDCYPDLPGVRQDIADYLGSIQIIDDIVQACLDTLKAQSLDEETLIIFTSDHGIGLHRAKQSIYSTGTQIPLLISGPGIVGGRRIREPVSHLDLAPTLIDFMGMPQLPGHLGKSLRPILEGKTEDFADRRTILTASHRYATARAVTDGRYYLVHNITKPRGSIKAPLLALNAGQWQSGAPWFNRTYQATMSHDSPQRDLLLQTLTGVSLSEFELFDLDHDLWCVKNLIAEPELTGIKKTLLEELVQWRTATEDYHIAPSEMTRRTDRYRKIDKP